MGYRITIRQSDFLTFTEELTNCDGSQNAVFTNTACSIPIDVLTAAPFSLTRGLSVWAKIVAINMYGDSEESDQGNGAKIVLVPDAPLSL